MNKVKEYTIDFTNVKYYLEMHEIIRDSLNFPAYYGCNWDAFWDCITDMVGKKLYIRIIGIENIRKKFNDEADILKSILEEFKHYENDLYINDISIEIIYKDGKKTVIE